MTGRTIFASALAAMAVLMTSAGDAQTASEPGTANAECRAGEGGPAARVEVVGLKDNHGTLRLELYPATSDGWLAPDRDLIASNRPFRRVINRVPSTRNAIMCIRAPAAGTYGLIVLHDRDSNRRFGFFSDGVGFSNNPVLHRSKPEAASVAISIGPGVTQTRIVMNYRRGFGMGPLPAPAPTR